jgi:hypothetical protein
MGLAVNYNSLCPEGALALTQGSALCCCPYSMSSALRPVMSSTLYVISTAPCNVVHALCHQHCSL